MDTHDYTSHRELFAWELHRLRTTQGFSKTQFALMVGISRRYLIKLEAAEASPTLDMIERIAAGFNITARDMVDFEAIEQRLSTSADANSVEQSTITEEYRG